MDLRIQDAIEQHKDYQRLQSAFPLDFVVECNTNSRRREPALSYGKIMREFGRDPSLFIAQMLYHERVELEELRKLEYSDNQLGEHSTNKPHFEEADQIAKRKELIFLQDVGEEIKGTRFPFLAFVFAGLTPSSDYGIEIPPYDIIFRSCQRRINAGMTEYQDPFSIDNVNDAIELYTLGGERCFKRSTSFEFAKKYIGKEEPPKRVEPWMMA